MLHRCLDVAYEQSRGIVRTWQSQGNQARCLMLELSGLSFGTCPEPNIGAHLFMLKPSYDGLHAIRMQPPIWYADCEAPQNSALSAASCQVLRGALVRVCTDCFRIIPGAADRPTLAHRTGAVAARSTRLAPLRIECHRRGSVEGDLVWPA